MTTNHHVLGYDGLYHALWRASHWIWERRAQAKKVGFSFSEETVTETILLDIATEAATQVKIFPLNKHEEGKVGADWEWIFYNQAQSVFSRWLVQAKVLDDNDHQYAHIDRYIGQSGVRQIDRLIDTANKRGIPALYGFYNHLSDEVRLPGQNCSCACNFCWGFSVANADSVRAFLPDRTFETLKTISMPISCMFCPDDSSPPGPGQLSVGQVARFSHRLDRLAGRSEADVLVDVLQDRYMTRHAPDYFHVLRELDAGRPEQQLRDKLSFRNPGVDGFVLISASEDVSGPPTSDTSQ